MKKTGNPKKNVILISIFLFLFVGLTSGCYLFRRKNYFSGRHFSMQFPLDWVKGEFNYPTIKMIYIDREPEVETYVTKARNPLRERPQAVISVYAAHLTRPIWVEDEIKTIRRALEQARYKILNSGNMQISGQQSFWLLLKDDDQQALILEFYFVDEGSTFYKIQYGSDISKFKQYRPDFEAARETFKIKFGIF